MEIIQRLSTYLEHEISGYNLPEKPTNLYDPLRYFLGLGGKRMRPILTLMAGECFGISKEESLPTALAIEFFHNFSLIHDDIMDVAPTRRGKQTVHQKWNQNIAILSGDVLLVKAYEKLAEIKDHRLSLLLQRFNDTAIEVCEGQQMDMDFEKMTKVSIENYIEMIRLKTSVLLGCALEFGAILANSCEEERIALYDFGVNLGIAFQIQDDIMDLYADPEKFGKQVGGDIFSAKKTLLMIEASLRSEKEVSDLIQLKNDRSKIETAQKLFNEIGATSATQKYMEFYHDKAIASLKNMPIDQQKLGPLYEMADYLFARVS